MHDARPHAHTHACTHTDTHTHTRTHTHTHAGTHTHACTHTRMHTHTRCLCICMCLRPYPLTRLREQNISVHCQLSWWNRMHAYCVIIVSRHINFTLNQHPTLPSYHVIISPEVQAGTNKVMCSNAYDTSFEHSTSGRGRMSVFIVWTYISNAQEHKQVWKHVNIHVFYVCMYCIQGCCSTVYGNTIRYGKNGFYRIFDTVYTVRYGTVYGTIRFFAGWLCNLLGCAICCCWWV